MLYFLQLVVQIYQIYSDRQINQQIFTFNWNQRVLFFFLDQSSHMGEVNWWLNCPQGRTQLWLLNAVFTSRSWMRGETSSRNWNKSSCLQDSTENYHDLDDWEPSSKCICEGSVSILTVYMPHLWRTGFNCELWLAPLWPLPVKAGDRWIFGQMSLRAWWH